MLNASTPLIHATRCPRAQDQRGGRFRRRLHRVPIRQKRTPPIFSRTSALRGASPMRIGLAGAIEAFGLSE